MNRRDFLKAVGLGAAAWGARRLSLAAAAGGGSAERPNVVLCMTDDQGWGDVAYNGHKHLKTPVLDEMARTCLRFDRFYAAAPVCSPTRGSVMTGRHPNRFGCFLYNYSIRPEEVTLAEALKGAGYATGHFGKWHLGPVKADSPTSPGACGFDEWLSHDNFFELDPSLSRNGAEPRKHEGESSEIVVAEALRFIAKAAKARKPFLAVVWFGSPHTPYKALPADREPYADLPAKQQHYLGEIAAMDRAMGRLRAGLRKLKVADNTLLWFCSDNGATGPGSTGGLKGKKGGLSEGGIRVPGILDWPARIRKPMATAVPCCTSDIYPTVLDLAGVEVADQVRPIDGISLRGVIDGTMRRRPKPIAFWKYPSRQESRNPPYLPPDKQKGWWRTFRNHRHPAPATSNFGGEAALIDNRYKLHVSKGGARLFDIAADPAESRDLAAAHGDLVARMRSELGTWQASVERSLSGRDYPSGRKR